MGLTFSFSYAQKLHSMKDIFMILEKSEITYSLEELENEIPVPDRSKNVNNTGYYREKEDNGSYVAKAFMLNEETKDFFGKAEEAFNDNNEKQAREYYLKALKSDSSFYEVMTYIGQTYEGEGNIDNAIEWYQKTIDANYIDYMAHWFLADAYFKKEMKKEALDEITIALILNRNNPRLKQSYSKIYKSNKFKFDDWYYNPQFQIDSIDDETVLIKYQLDWMGAALVRAVWLYEPDYAESMGSERGVVSIKQCKEELIGLFSNLDKKRMKKYPEFKALKKALGNDYYYEYVLYEMILPDYPHVVYQLPKTEIKKIKDYVLKIRGGKKK